MTCYRGAVVAVLEGDAALTLDQLDQLDQLVVRRGRTLWLWSTADATLQFIWAPPHATPHAAEAAQLCDLLSKVDALGELGWVFVVKVDGGRDCERYTVVASRGGDAFRATAMTSRHSSTPRSRTASPRGSLV